MRASNIATILFAAYGVCACASPAQTAAAQVLQTASLDARGIETPTEGKSTILISAGGRVDGSFSTPMNRTSVVTPPTGFVFFCKANPTECLADNSSKSKKEPVALTAASFQELGRVNQDVNDAIFPVSDDRLYGGQDVWVVAPSEGDCDDYAVTKRDRLLRAGWPARSLLLTVATTPQGERHALLVVATDHGDLVLDNRSTWILPWQKAHYQWVAQQSAINPTVWQAIAPASAMMASAD